MSVWCCCFSSSPSPRSSPPPAAARAMAVELSSPRTSELPTFMPDLLARASALPPLDPAADVPALHAALRHAAGPIPSGQRLDDIDQLFWQASQARMLTQQLFLQELAARCEDSAQVDDLGPRVVSLFRQGPYELSLQPGGAPSDHLVWPALPILFGAARSVTKPFEARGVPVTQARMMGVVSNWLLGEDSGLKSLGGFSSLSFEERDKGLRALLQGVTVVSYWNGSSGHWENLLGPALSRVVMDEPQVPWRDAKGGQEAVRREVAWRHVVALSTRVPGLRKALVEGDIQQMRAVSDAGQAYWGREVAREVERTGTLIPPLADLVGAYVGGDTPMAPFVSIRPFDD